MKSAARDLWNRGNNGAALDRLAAVLKQAPRDSEAASIADDFLRQARAKSATAGAVARDVGADKGTTFSAGRARETDGQRLAGRREFVDAARQYLDAAALFSKAAAEQPAAASPAPPIAVVEPPLKLPESATAAQPPAAPSTPNQATTTPAARPEPPQPTPTQRPSPPVAAPQDDDAAIRQTLQRYAAAYETLNADAVKAVYPSIDAASLAGTLKEYASLRQTVKVESVAIARDGRTAIATAMVTTAPTLKRGRASPFSGRVKFTLRKNGDTWMIESSAR